ncbi:MAG: HNH endonuclease [Bacteroidia bacterium]|nr:HNH endonuclease [Bacteroidia bacterium]
MKLATQAKKTESKICPKCGKEFHRRRFGERLEDFTRWNQRIYCSKQCSYIRPPLSNKTSYHRLARTFLSQSCQNCGSMENLDVHHKDRNYKNNDPDNLQTLCHSCHMKYHWQQGHLKVQWHFFN